jgi:hypothetical protein
MVVDFRNQKDKQTRPPSYRKPKSWWQKAIPCVSLFLLLPLLLLLLLLNYLNWIRGRKLMNSLILMKSEKEDPCDG